MTEEKTGQNLAQMIDGTMRKESLGTRASGDPHITPEQLEDYEAYIKANFDSGFSLEWAQTRFQNNRYKSMWLTIANWFNAAAGLAPYISD